ncbi:MAG: potassium channel family protein [Christensenellales bacterium]
MKSMLVIGIGRFGHHLAVKLAELGNEVMIIDECEECIEKLVPLVTSARIGDCMNEDVIKSLGVSNFDICFVCIGENFQSSLEITSLLKDNGAKFVVAKTDREIQAKFLLRIGADDVIYPERDMAHRTAVKYSTRHAFDYIELAPEFGIYEIETPAHWAGKTIRELQIRSKYGINIIAAKLNGHIFGLPGADHVCNAAEHLIIAGDKKANMRVLEKIDR